MAFKLVMRHNIEQTADDFDLGDVRSFDQADISVGSGAECDCVVASDELPPVAFRILGETDSDDHRVQPGAAARVYVNQVLLEGEQPLCSGDEIRCGHWTFRFQKVYRAVRQARRADGLAILAKVLVALMFVSELILVYWLPRQFQSARLLALEIRREESTALLDDLRLQIRWKDPRRDQNPLQTGARNLLLEELDTLGEYIRENDHLLSKTQWDALYAELQHATHLLDRINRAAAIPPLPELSIDSAVEALISQEKDTTFAEE